MKQRAFFSLIGISGLWPSLLAALLVLAAYTGLSPLTKARPLRLGTLSHVATDLSSFLNPSLSISAPGSIDAAASPVCDTYYFHDQMVNVGNHGNRKIANTTAPLAGSPQVVEVTLPFLSGNDVEITRFYSDPATTSALSILGDVVGSVWLQTTDFDNTTFTVRMFDYNPANGNTLSIGTLEFKVLTDGQNEVDIFITPQATNISAGHRLLFIIYARSPALTSPTVKIFYDSSDRASRYIVCHPAPPNLIVSKSGPATAIAGQSITYTLTITNNGGVSATNLLISDTVPAGANYVSGGALSGNEVTWSVASLAPGNGVQRTFLVTATATITNDDYAVNADNNVSAVGQEPVVTVVSQPGHPNLTISKSGPASVSVGESITYILTVTNGGDTTATNLQVSDMIPAGATYVSGGTKSGNMVTWTLGSLAPGEKFKPSFTVTANSTITNDTYQVTAGGGISLLGQKAVTTMITPKEVYLPVVLKSGPLTKLIVESVNTGGIPLLRVIDPNNGSELLRCSIGNNVTKTCGSFAAIGTYKIVANTNNCGVLQGTFNDASPGATVKRRVFCS